MLKRKCRTKNVRDAEMAEARRKNEEYKAFLEARTAIPIEQHVKVLHDTVCKLPRNQQLMGFTVGMMIHVQGRCVRLASKTRGVK